MTPEVKIKAPHQFFAASHSGVRRRKQSVDAPWAELRREAHRRFGIDRFRPGQREVLEAIFGGRNVMAVMPTGAGKSLCYQLPALFLPGTVLVISPLIALMQDQQEKAEQAEIAVEKVDSTLTRTEAAEAADAIRAGIPQLLYVTPERLENPEFIETLARSGVSLMAVDEAHCISQWGHDFRPAYLHLREARRRLGNPPVVALTATATGEVIHDVLEQLGAKDAVIVDTGTERENLALSVSRTVNGEAKERALLTLLADEQGSGIVYTATVRTATELYESLKEGGVSVGLYHGRLRVREREAMQRGFMAGDYKVLVATKAFGLGIDKKDTRFVYHYEFPDSLDSYYQEAGRAGRDGQPAHAALFYRIEDKRIQQFFLVGKYPRLQEATAVYDSLGRIGTLAEIAKNAGVPKTRTQVILHLLAESGFAHRVRGGFSVTGKQPGNAELDALLASYVERGTKDKQRLEEMVRYAESATCRKQLIRTYFGEEIGTVCGNCDNCRAAEQAAPVIEAPPDLKQLLVR